METIVDNKLNTLLNATDRNGKKLIYKPEDGHRIYLDIDGVVRCLGAIILGKNHILYHKFEDERNVFRKTDAWSINHTVLSNVDDVVYETHNTDYHITKERALEFGEFFHFQDTTELKVYVPRKYWHARHKGMKDIFPEKFRWSNLVGDSWYPVLEDTLKSPLIQQIGAAVRKSREFTTVYPTPDRVFRALKETHFAQVKVVIVGQDPYYDGSANGLAFGYLDVTESKKSVQKSLDVIYKEVERDIYKGLHLDHDYSLESWARQGVLLLNTVLTVEKGRPKSHAGIGWERFTKIVLKKTMDDPSPKVYITWGNDAKEHFNAVLDVWKAKNFVSFPHLHLEGYHPAYDLRKADTFGDITPDYPRTFSGGAYFSRANEFLKLNNRKPIKW